MTFKEFKDSLIAGTPPPELSQLGKALWHDAKGDWTASHTLAQDVNTPDGSWVHAYLHRKEGDLANALYWYSLANRKMPGISLEEEWEGIVRSLLAHRQSSLS